MAMTSTGKSECNSQTKPHWHGFETRWGYRALLEEAVCNQLKTAPEVVHTNYSHLQSVVYLLKMGSLKILLKKSPRENEMSFGAGVGSSSWWVRTKVATFSSKLLGVKENKKKFQK